VRAAPPQDTLGVEAGDVEAWVVRAIGKRLLDARIDQLQAAVTITRASHRSFGDSQWRDLRDQLGVWRVSGCLSDG
jgi:translation initiation factor 3 subunit M